MRAVVAAAFALVILSPCAFAAVPVDVVATDPVGDATPPGIDLVSMRTSRGGVDLVVNLTFAAPFDANATASFRAALNANASSLLDAEVAHSQVGAIEFPEATTDGGPWPPVAFDIVASLTNGNRSLLLRLPATKALAHAVCFFPSASARLGQHVDELTAPRDPATMCGRAPPPTASPVPLAPPFALAAIAMAAFLRRARR